MDYKPYTYLIGWSKLDRWYYGCRYAKGCRPEELWKTYFTSSKHVKAFREENGDPDVIEIRKIFLSEDVTRKWESGVLKRMKVVDSEKWLNKTDNISISRDCSAYVHSDATRKKKSLSRMGMKMSDETKKKLSEIFKGRDVHWIKGKKRPEHGKLISEIQKKPVIYNEIEYPSMKELRKQTGINIYQYYKKLKEGSISYVQR